jgi:dTDP-4-dehydrorhamnose reductase
VDKCKVFSCKKAYIWHKFIYRKMRVLVTGADGQLGKALAGVADGGDEWLFSDVGGLDITDAAAVVAFFEKERPAVVVNCAAWTDVDGAEREREAAFRVNADAPGILARAARGVDAALIHISTDFVFDGTARRPYVEDDATAPINVYGESKLAGERAVLSSGVRGAVIRTSWLYSPWGKNFVKAILGAAKGRDEIRVVSDQWGCPTSAASLAGAIVRMIPAFAAGRGLGAAGMRGADIYHFCDAGVVSRADFAAEILRRAGLSTRVIPVSTAEFSAAAHGAAGSSPAVTPSPTAAPSPVAARRPAYSALDTTKITQTLGITPRPWQEALADVLK